MKIKRFVAADMRSAMNLVRKEHGPDAVILSNRRIEEGVEIVAAANYDESAVQRALEASRRDVAPPPAPKPRTAADAVIDTSGLNVHQLRRRIVTEFTMGHATSLSLLFESFAYKRGVPAEADFVFDARVLPNPHWDPELRALSGREPGVREYLEAQPDVQRYLTQLMDFLDTWLPKLADGTRSYVTVAFGCTGGKHRSVFLAERMARHAREMGWEDVATYHREQD